MPISRGGKDYLNATESTEFLETSFVTFQEIQKVYGLKPKSFVGQGRQVFFLKRHLDLIKNSATSDQAKIKAIIAEEQAQVE